MMRPAPLTQQERDAVDDIFTIAAHHDRECQRAWQVISDALISVPGRTATVDSLEIEEQLYHWESAVSELHGTIARAALERAPLLGLFDGDILGLHGGELARLLRPIFEEAGIADRFVTSSTSAKIESFESEREWRDKYRREQESRP
ncbi:MAG: hypothetical protein M3O91_08870 [Chloroflexota bacterium]|nr:hypothetical protein [Chloroflexota bacterium]